MNTGLSKVLGYITSVKGLAAIRDEVWELLHEVRILPFKNEREHGVCLLNKSRFIQKGYCGWLVFVMS